MMVFNAQTSDLLFLINGTIIRPDPEVKSLAVTLDSQLSLTL